MPDDLPMVVEEETGFHFRSRAGRLRIAMHDPEPRWGFDIEVDESVFDDRLAREYPAFRERQTERLIEYLSTLVAPVAPDGFRAD